ncbi:hypothetical protein SAMN05444372_11097 [Flavobacterium micromati]|uniref:Uncharacterized protein n=1 Tax=Flavobacterium micromati TaxID=229205 RepID=A0A1M5MZG2_9FLAO|nr:hypothetical protein [Flavobacterium micromati]SHG82617.1 hypothetical protein SAMN05444372_11097 [Flavobacterium micromati]
MNYSYDLMQAILWNRIDVQSVMDIAVVPIQGGVDAYKSFSDGSSKKFVINPNGYLKNS